MELNLILDAIQREMDSDTPAHDRATRHYLGLLGVWLERQAARSRAGSAGARCGAAPGGALYRAAGARVPLGRGVADYAAALGVTPTHLTRCCKLACGRPGLGLAAGPPDLRGAPAAGRNRLPVGHIARDLGFTSPAYFTRAFQHQTGKTPSAFRRAP